MNQKTLFTANHKLLAAATAAACLALAAFAAGCGLVSTTNTQPTDAAARQATLAPAASTPQQQTPPNTPQSPSPDAAPNPSPATAVAPLPAPTGFVNDYAKVLDEESRRRLEEKLRLLKERGNVEFAVATVETTGGQSTDDYSLALAKGWGVGSKETGDGLLLLLAVRDRMWRVQVSRSLEPALSNDAVAEICQSAAPLYREGRYGAGIAKCVDGLTARLAEKKRINLD